jgi:hypothetical protein
LVFIPTLHDWRFTPSQNTATLAAASIGALNTQAAPLAGAQGRDQRGTFNADF